MTILVENIYKNNKKNLIIAKLEKYQQIKQLEKLENIVIYIKASFERTRVFIKIKIRKIV